MGPPVPSDYPEFDPILVKCVSFLQVGGKESRRSLKELINELVKGDEKSDTPHSSRGSSPNVMAQTKVDKRKGGQLDKDAVKKARLEATGESAALPRFTNKPGILTEPCCVCDKSTNAPKDQLIDCNDCHLSYHQLCHDPPIPDSVIQERQSDPRSIWQCKSCQSSVPKITTKKKSENQQKEKNPSAEPFKRQDKLQNIKSTSSSREGSPSLTGWGSLMGKESESDKSKRKKEKKLQQIDMFGQANDSDNASSAGGSQSKKKKEVNPSAIKALKDKTSRKKEEEKGKKSLKSKEKEEADAHKKLHSMKKKSAEKAKLKAAAKRV